MHPTSSPPRKLPEGALPDGIEVDASKAPTNRPAGPSLITCVLWCAVARPRYVRGKSSTGIIEGFFAMMVFPIILPRFFARTWWWLVRRVHRRVNFKSGAAIQRHDGNNDNQKSEPPARCCIPAPNLRAVSMPTASCPASSGSSEHHL